MDGCVYVVILNVKEVASLIRAREPSEPSGPSGPSVV